VDWHIFTMSQYRYVHENSAAVHEAELANSRHHHLQRDTAISRVLKEDAAVDLALVEVLRLVTVVDDVGGTGGLLKYAELELTATSEVGGFVVGDCLQFSGSDGVVDGDLAVNAVSVLLNFTSQKLVFTSCCSPA
jgi:hypothetical protein